MMGAPGGQGALSGRFSDPVPHRKWQGLKSKKPPILMGRIKKLFGYMGRYKFLLLIVLVFAIASTMSTILAPKILGTATTKLVDGILAQVNGTGSIDFNGIFQIILEVLVLVLICSACGIIQGWIMGGIAANITYQFRRDIAEKINRLPLKYFDKTTHGEVLFPNLERCRYD